MTWRRHCAVWAIALPAMLTNLATALFGLADMWTIGRIGDPAAQGAVELGARAMMVSLVVFNFLRSGTIALTAQAAGRADEGEQVQVLVRAAGLALGIGALLLLAWPLVVPLGLDLLAAEGEVRTLAAQYVHIRYPGATAWLLGAVLTGWLIGRGRLGAVLAVEVGANLLHIALDLVLVLGAGMGVAGVAVATLGSEFAKLAALTFVVTRFAPLGALAAAARSVSTWRLEPMVRLFAMNRDLFLRTLLLTGAIALLTRTGAQQGASVLAANGIIFQLFMLSSLLLDGFESAAQVLCGRAAGKGDGREMRAMIGLNLGWGAVLGLAIAAVYWIGRGPLADTFSTDPGVVATTALYLPWAALLPIAGVASYVLDGAFIGASWTKALLISMAGACVVYAAALALTAPLGNHGLWISFLLFLLARAAGQALLLPTLLRRSFAEERGR